MKAGLLTISFRELGRKPRAYRTKRAVNYLRKQLEKNLRKGEADIVIAREVNEFIWNNGIQNIPVKVELNIIEKDGKARVYLKEGKQLVGEQALEKESKEKKKKEKKAEKPKEKTEEELKKEKELQEKRAKEKMVEKLELKRKE